MLDHPAVPPPDLIYLVSGHRDPELFLQSGARSRADLESALARHGRTIASFRRVLDFGVGCGRLARHLHDVEDLYGVDVMPELVSWSAANLAHGTYLVTDELPPLPFDDGSLDLIVNHSVFTHLDVEHQDAWLAELARVLAPEGMAVLSFSGLRPLAGYLTSLRDGGAPERAVAHQARFARDGYLWVEDDQWQESDFPDWYHSMFHDPAYVLQHWGMYLRPLSWKEGGNLGFQDTIVLGRRTESHA